MLNASQDDLTIKLRADDGQFAEVTNLAAAGLDKVTGAAKTVGGALGQVSQQSALTRQQMMSLNYTVSDTVASLASGMSPLTILLQQGPQLRDAFGGVGAAFRGVLTLLSPTVVALGGAVAGVASLGLAYRAAERETEAYRLATVLTGNAVGATADQLQLAARSVAQSVGTQGQAADVVAQLAASGRVAAADLAKLTEAAVRLQREGGPAVEDTVKAFAELGKAPTAGALKLNESTRFLTISVLEQVRALEDQGRSFEAARLAQSTYADESIRRAKELEASISGLEFAWRKVGGALKFVADQTVDLFRPETLQKQIADLDERIAILRRMGQGGGLLGMVADYFIGNAQDDRGALNRSAINASERAGQAGAAAAATEAYEKARQANDRWAKAALSNTEKMNEALLEYRRNLAVVQQGRTEAGLAPIGAAQIAREEAALRASFAGPKKKPDFVGPPDELFREMERERRDLRRAERDSILENMRNEIEAEDRRRREQQRIGRELDRAGQFGQQLVGGAEGIYAQLIPDAEARGRALLAIERAQLTSRVQQFEVSEQQRRLLMYEVDQFMVAREAELTEQLKPEWQRRLEAWEDTNALMRDSYDNLMQGIVDEGERAFSDWVRTGKLSTRSLVSFIGNEFAKLGYRQFLAGGVSQGASWLLNAIGLGRGAVNLGTVTGGDMAQFWHGGGVVGVDQPARTLRMPATTWVGAPMFHAGMLAAGEYPAVLQRGESVLTPGQMRALAGASAPPVIQNNYYSVPPGYSPAAYAAALQEHGRQVKGEIAADMARPGRTMQRAVRAAMV